MDWTQLIITAHAMQHIMIHAHLRNTVNALPCPVTPCCSEEPHHLLPDHGLREEVTQALELHQPEMCLCEVTSALHQHMVLQASEGTEP